MRLASVNRTPDTTSRRAGAAGADRFGRRPAIFVVVMCAGYAAALWWIDRGNGMFLRLAGIWPALLLAMPIMLLTYLVRYWRWDWLLRRNGLRLPLLDGLTAYLAGLALTATPGKAGELLRIRYFARMGVRPERSFATFVFERASDLLVILLFSLLAAPIFPTLGVLAAVVLAFVGALFALAAWPGGLRWSERAAQRIAWQWLRRMARFATGVAHELRHCLDGSSLVRSLLAGLAAWGATSVTFLWICSQLGLSLPPLVGLGIYPLAMLIGALSFVPGGVGTTELAIVLMLERLGVPSAAGWTAAVAIRLVTLWFAIAVGALAMLWMELRGPAPLPGGQAREGGT